MAETNDPIEAFYREIQALLGYLKDKSEISYAVNTELHFKKALLLSCASLCETRLTETLQNFTKTRSSNCESLMSFVSKKGIDRQYHTYFDWDSGKPNKFIGLFGESFKNKIQDEFKKNENLRRAAENFVKLGALRNNLVHRNYISFNIDQTSDDIYQLYNDAKIFIAFFNSMITTS